MCKLLCCLQSCTGPHERPRWLLTNPLPPSASVSQGRSVKRQTVQSTTDLYSDDSKNNHEPFYCFDVSPLHFPAVLAVHANYQILLILLKLLVQTIAAARSVKCITSCVSEDLSMEKPFLNLKAFMTSGMKEKHTNLAWINCFSENPVY